MGYAKGLVAVFGAMFMAGLAIASDEPKSGTFITTGTVQADGSKVYTQTSEPVGEARSERTWVVPLGGPMPQELMPSQQVPKSHIQLANGKVIEFDGNIRALADGRIATPDGTVYKMTSDGAVQEGKTTPTAVTTAGRPTTLQGTPVGLSFEEPQIPSSISPSSSVGPTAKTSSPSAKIIEAPKIKTLVSLESKQDGGKKK